MTRNRKGGFKIQFSLYHANFRQRRRECLEKSGKQCQRCGIKHRSFAFNHEGELFIVYLQAAHVWENEKLLPDAPLICLCLRCHRLYDMPRKVGKGAVEDWAFIGLVAKAFLEEQVRDGFVRVLEEVRSPEYQQIVS